MKIHIEEKVHVKGNVENLDLRVGDYKALVSLTRQILKEAENLPAPTVPEELLKQGLASSEKGSEQPKTVPMTPIMENMFKEEGQELPLPFDAPLTPVEIRLNEKVKQRLTKVNGAEDLSYKPSEDLLSSKYYDVDCWRNRKDNMRDIGPGQAKQRAAMLVKYTKKPDFGPLLRKLEEDRVLQKAIQAVWAIMPSVSADEDFTETALPFDKKHSNVGYPFFHRDNAVDPETGKTYGQLSKELAKSQDFGTLPNYNVAMVFGRNQRLKGRLIIAMSRVVNLFFNRLEAKEIEALKTKCPPFAGYRDAEQLKQVLKTMAGQCQARGFGLSNWDQSAFDVHINPVWLALVGAMRVASTRGALGKKIAYWRAVYNIRQWVIDGLSGTMVGIWGRMPSGYIDTNQADSWIEIIASAYCLALQDPEYFELVWHALGYPILAMGDDCLMSYRREHFSSERFIADMSELGFEMNLDKYDYGAFFLQNRLFHEKVDRMAYPWTRVLKSMLFKENPRQLGTYGWLVSQLQQLSKLFEDAQALDSVVMLTAPYDKLRLGLNTTVQEIVAGIKAEDEKARREQKPSEWRPTAEKLYDGDPQKSQQFEDGALDEGWIAEALSVVKRSLKRCGIRT